MRILSLLLALTQNLKVAYVEFCNDHAERSWLSSPPWTDNRVPYLLLKINHLARVAFHKKITRHEMKKITETRGITPSNTASDIKRMEKYRWLIPLTSLLTDARPTFITPITTNVAKETVSVMLAQRWAKGFKYMWTTKKMRQRIVRNTERKSACSDSKQPLAIIKNRRPMRTPSQ